MKIIVESTETTLTLDGVPVRKWEGVNEDGSPVVAYIHRIGISNTVPVGPSEASLIRVPDTKEVGAFEANDSG